MIKKHNLCYIPETGEFFRNEERADHARKDGYCRVYFEGKRELAHRVAWFFVNDKWPDNVIDHIDGNPSNNKIDNLRQATHSQNMQNSVHPVGSSGVKGVHWHALTGKWAVKIFYRNRCHYFGTYKDLELAELVANEAREKLHKDFSNFTVKGK